MLLLARTPIPDEPLHWVSQAIVALTHGPFCHTEILLDDGRGFSSEAGRGVRFLPADRMARKLDVYAAYWEQVELPWKPTPPVLAWCEAENGSPYDYIGAVNSAIGMALESPSRWFCSEICAAVLLRCGALAIPPLLHPSALYQWVLGELAGVPRAMLAANLLSQMPERAEWPLLSPRDGLERLAREAVA